MGTLTQKKRLSTLPRLIGLGLALGLALAWAPEAPAALIRLKAITFQPGKETSATLQSAAQDPYWLVQFAHTLSHADRVLLKRAGARIISYIPDDAFLIRADPKAVAALRQTAGVTWVGPYLPQYRISPSIAQAAGSIHVRVLGFPGDTAAGLARVLRLGGVSVQSASDRPSGPIAVVKTSPATAESLGQAPGVRWVEIKPEPRLLNDVARGIMNVNPVWTSVGLYGQGQIVGVSDTGLDVGATSPSLDADFQGRVAAAYALGRPGLTNDPNGHGTHVCGSILGNGALSGSNPATHTYTGTSVFAGVAPEADLVIQSILDSSGGLGGIPPDLNTLFAQAYAAGARIHSNSWGSPVSGAYDVSAEQVDQYAWSQRDMVIVVAAGNSGVDANSDGVIDQGSMDSPGTAKDCITVGATESQRSTGGYQFTWGTKSWAALFPAEPIKSGLISAYPYGMAAFSSRGPCVDGRIKPDICAPGTNIISCRSHDPSVTQPGWGVYNADYIYDGGTSMATPMVTGCAALIREYYTDVLNMTPSSALIKAALLASAYDMNPGQYGTGPTQEMTARPNNVEGWGRVDLKAAIDPDPPVAREQVDDQTGINTGDIRAYTYNVVDTSVPLHIVLVWTDYPGDPAAAKALVNDLDLTVQAPDATIYDGNGTLDHTNNVEGVDILNPEQGAYTVTVSAYNVPQGPQPFALVVEGGLPHSYIMGKVTSSSGAPVPGVNVKAESANGTFTADTATDGSYTIMLPPDSYTVTPSRPGWTFSPLQEQAIVTASGVTNEDFTGTAAPASIRGTVYMAAIQTVTASWQSSHPYPNQANLTTTITGPSNAARIRLHFTQINLESGYDFLHIKDGQGNEVMAYTGQLAALWSPWVNGNVVEVNLVSDTSGNAYGWQVDKYQVCVPGGPASGVGVLDSHSGQQAVTGSNGQYLLSALEPLPTTVAASLPNYIASPPQWNLWPNPGQSVTGQDFLLTPEPPVVHVNISHQYIGDLVITVGVGNPNSPIWSQVIDTRQGGNGTSLKLDVPLDDALPYFPPTPSQPWFVTACDVTPPDAGQFNSISVSKGGNTWPALNMPVLIPDNACVTVTIPDSTPNTIGSAGQNPDGLPLYIWGGVVSGKFSDRFYLQDPLRSAGIGVLSTANVNPGDIVSVSGTLETDGCERRIGNATVAINSSPSPPPVPLYMAGRVVGGAPAIFTPGFSDSADLNNLGLLISVAGRVTATGPDWFYASDGSAHADGSGFPGIRVSAPGMPIPPAGSFVKVTGISECLDAGFGSARVVYCRTANDIEVMQSPTPIFTDNFESGGHGWQALHGYNQMNLSQVQSHSLTHSLAAAGGAYAADMYVLPSAYGPAAGLRGWFYDDGSAPSATTPITQGMELRSLTPAGALADRFVIGINSPTSPGYYSVYTTSDGWSATGIARSIGWHQFGIRIAALPGPPDAVRFLIGGAQVATGRRATDIGVSEIVLGSPDGPGGLNAYFDDIVFGYGQ